MAYTIEIAPSAARDIAGLPQKVRKAVARKIDGLKQQPRPRGVEKL